MNTQMFTLKLRKGGNDLLGQTWNIIFFTSVWRDKFEEKRTVVEIMVMKKQKFCL